jgi:hypothetical protein
MTLPIAIGHGSENTQKAKLNRIRNGQLVLRGPYFLANFSHARQRNKTVNLERVSDKA